MGPNYQLTSASGTESVFIGGIHYNANITGLSAYAGADNLLDATFLMPDFGGFSFATDVAFGTNGFLTCGNNVVCAIKEADDPVGNASSGFPLTYSAHIVPVRVPEPKTIAMFAMGIVTLVMMRRRKQSGAI